MEWAMCTASSDSEDAMTREINEEDGSPSNRGHQDSCHGAGEQSSTKDAHGSVDLMFVKEAAPTRNGWDSIDPVKAEAGKKPSDQHSQDLIHFEKKQGVKRPAPDSMGSARTVNISEGAGIRDREPENITVQMVREEEDEEQELVRPEDLGEWAAELKFDSSTSRAYIEGDEDTRKDARRDSLNLILDEAAIRRKKRNERRKKGPRRRKIKGRPGSRVCRKPTVKDQVDGTDNTDLPILLQESTEPHDSGTTSPIPLLPATLTHLGFLPRPIVSLCPKPSTLSTPPAQNGTPYALSHQERA